MTPKLGESESTVNQIPHLTRDEIVAAITDVFGSYFEGFGPDFPGVAEWRVEALACDVALRLLPYLASQENDDSQ